MKKNLFLMASLGFSLKALAMDSLSLGLPTGPVVLTTISEPNSPKETTNSQSMASTITEESFAKAFTKLRLAEGYEVLADHLESKLKKYIGTEIEDEKWEIEVSEAYTEFVTQLSKTERKNTYLKMPFHNVMLLMAFALVS
jgi:hypothetical protein